VTTYKYQNTSKYFHCDSVSWKDRIFPVIDDIAKMGIGKSIRINQTGSVLDEYCKTVVRANWIMAHTIDFLWT
jgi:hypothetical protein